MTPPPEVEGRSCQKCGWCRKGCDAAAELSCGGGRSGVDGDTNKLADADAAVKVASNPGAIASCTACRMNCRSCVAVQSATYSDASSTTTAASPSSSPDTSTARPRRRGLARAVAVVAVRPTAERTVRMLVSLPWSCQTSRRRHWWCCCWKFRHQRSRRRRSPLWSRLCQPATTKLHGFWLHDSPTQLASAACW